jgi:hypothetical protein
VVLDEGHEIISGIDAKRVNASMWVGGGEEVGRGKEKREEEGDKGERRRGVRTHSGYGEREERGEEERERERS